MKLLWLVLTMELRRSFAYRAEFWLRFLGLLVAQVVIAYYLWKAIYAQSPTPTIGGYSFPAMVAYYIMVPLVENITRPTDRSNIAAEIYGGTLTRYLIYPLSFFPYKYASTLATSVVATVQLLGLLALAKVFGWFPADLQVTGAAVAMGMTAAAVASLLNFAMISLVEMTAFWADNVWSLNVMLSFVVRLLGGGLLPLSLFPGSVQAALKYTPFPYLVSFPVLTMIGRSDGNAFRLGVWVMAFWLAAFSGLLWVVWRRGLRQYSGVGM